MHIECENSILEIILVTKCGFLTFKNNKFTWWKYEGKWLIKNMANVFPCSKRFAQEYFCNKKSLVMKGLHPRVPMCTCTIIRKFWFGSFNLICPFRIFFVKYENWICTYITNINILPNIQVFNKFHIYAESLTKIMSSDELNLLFGYSISNCNYTIITFHDELRPNFGL